VTYNVYERWPEFQFKNRKAVPAGLQWSVYMTDPSGVKSTLICAIQGKSNTWIIPGYDAGTPRDLGVFKKRELAAAAYLEAASWKPERERLEAQYKEACWINAPRPLDKPLSSEVANEIWTILVEECGASEDSVVGRGNFVPFLLTEPSGGLSEYRFQGEIGFGGKIYFNPRQFYVGCYTEEETPYVLLMIARANARLQELHVKHWGTR